MLIESSNSDTKLEFSDHSGDYFTASIRSDSHSGSVRVYTHTDPYGVVRLFKDAASDWRGWAGEKYWESLEGEFRLEMSSDSVGHVKLKTTISHDCGNPDPWRLIAELGLDAGQLESVAKKVEQFFSG